MKDLYLFVNDAVIVSAVVAAGDGVAAVVVVATVVALTLLQLLSPCGRSRSVTHEYLVANFCTAAAAAAAAANLAQQQ